MISTIFDAWNIIVDLSKEKYVYLYESVDKLIIEGEIDLSALQREEYDCYELDYGPTKDKFNKFPKAKIIKKGTPLVGSIYSWFVHERHSRKKIENCYLSSQLWD